MQFVDRALTLQDVQGKHVLEVGSYDVNGSVRPLAMRYNPASYVGIDMRPGPGVDLAINATNIKAHFGDGSFDVVICTELLEHAEDWRAVINNLKDVLKPGGLLLLTTRSWGFPLHEYPGDFWRFEVSDMHMIFADMDLMALECDLQFPGVFVAAVKYQTVDEYSAFDVDLSTLAVRSMGLPNS
jgi:SAM-dependent methyltransferase